MEWLTRFSRVIDYIEDNLDARISSDEAARLACCSGYYFQRMFSYVTGISLAEYIRRRRMTAAAFELQNGSSGITEIAEKYGYVSLTSFNRAFHSVHGVSPTAARRDGTPLNAYPRISLSISVNGGANMRYRVEQKAPIRFVGVRTALSEDIEDNFKIAPAFWEKTLASPLFNQISRLNNRPPAGSLGVTCYLDPQNIFYSIAAATDAPAPAGMLAYEIPSATWAIFEVEGSLPAAIQTLFKRFYTEWLPFSGYSYAELPDIEVYPPGDPFTPLRQCEVWIAVKKQND